MSTRNHAFRASLAGATLRTRAGHHAGHAFADYGRIAKTLHLLAMCDPDETYRRTVHAQLTVQESRHRLARKIFHGQRGATTDIELDAASVLSSPGQGVADTGRQVAAALGRSDVLLYTSRTLIRGRDAADSLAIARMVSAALSQTVRQALAARPAWVIAKGGITSHDVAVHGLGIRRAEVAGQLFPSLISVFRPIDAAPGAIGVPYIVFAGNVGGDQALAQVVAILNGQQQDP
jgi:Nucleotide-binding C-terminal domain/Tn3 transposase DDE domain